MGWKLKIKYLTGGERKSKMPDYFVYQKDESWEAQRNRHNGKKPLGEIFNITAKTKLMAIVSAKKIVENIEKMQVEAHGSTISKSTETETKETK